MKTDPSITAASTSDRLREAATGKGFSYDNATLLLSEHTCAGANTCGGWNCVTP